MIRVEKHIYKANLALNESRWDAVISEAGASESLFRNNIKVLQQLIKERRISQNSLKNRMN